MSVLFHRTMKDLQILLLYSPTYPPMHPLIHLPDKKGEFQILALEDACMLNMLHFLFQSYHFRIWLNSVPLQCHRTTVVFCRIGPFVNWVALYRHKNMTSLICLSFSSFFWLSPHFQFQWSAHSSLKDSPYSIQIWKDCTLSLQGLCSPSNSIEKSPILDFQLHSPNRKWYAEKWFVLTKGSLWQSYVCLLKSQKGIRGHHDSLKRKEKTTSV